MSKPSKYIKSGKVRMARYVTYVRVSWCRHTSYPVAISYVQTCEDDVEDCPAGLSVSISGATTWCVPVFYIRSGDFNCNAAYTVVNPGCPPSGWTVNEVESPPAEITAEITGSDITGRVYAEIECDNFGQVEIAYGVFDVLDCASVSVSGYCVCFPAGTLDTYSGGGNYCGVPTTVAADFSLSYSCVPGSPGTITITINGARHEPYGFYGGWWFTGSLSDIPVDEYCRPFGAHTVPIYFQGLSGWTQPCSASMFSPAPIETPIYVGDMTVTFS